MALEYGGYRIAEGKNSITVENVRDFDPVHTFECGQCFRWIRQNDGSYTGVVKGRAVNVRCENGNLIINNSNTEDFINIWFDYFDLGTDYAEIKKKLKKDDVMKRAIDFGYGIRILRQDIWETLISFIISANNRIPMIMKVVEAISREYGCEIKFEEKSFFSFPDAEKLSGASSEELRFCKGGFRCKYIIGASRAVQSGEINLDELTQMDTESARIKLMTLPGVGRKVADCTLLYGGAKKEVFPVDVWIKRIMELLYFKREASLSEIQEFAAGCFGELAGIAQQYLFYYARENKIG